jgi:hypothetical protein
MPRQSTRKPSIPPQIPARRQRAVEQAREEYKQRKATTTQRDRLIAAGNLVDTLGEKFESEQKADRDYLQQWVKAIADYKALLGCCPNPRVPPAGLTEQNRDAWTVAVNIFMTTNTDPAQAIVELGRLAAKDPDFAVSVARWLRRGIRQVLEGYWHDGPAIWPPAGPREDASAETAELTPAPSSAESGTDERIKLIPGGFLLHGVTKHLAAKPLGVLRSLLSGRHHARTFSDLRDEVWGQDSVATHQNVKDAVKVLRKELCNTYKKATGTPLAEDPVPCVGKGSDLAWELKLDLLL